MAHYSYGQLESLWIDAGGPKKLAPLMAAIAEAESGGDSNAQNPSGASGLLLWQILGPPPGMTVQEMFNAQDNAKAAVWKYKNQGLGAWTTYTGGQYKKFLKGNVPDATLTAAQGGGGNSGPLNEWLSWIPGFGIPLQFMTGSADSLVGIANDVHELEKIINEFFTGVSWLFVPSHWVRILCFILGVPLVGMGLVTITVGTKPVPVSAYGVSTEVSTGGIAPALGIAEITLGAILLFFAFHNLESQGVTNFQGLLGYVRERVGSPSGKGSGDPGSTPAGIPPAGVL